MRSLKAANEQLVNQMWTNPKEMNAQKLHTDAQLAEVRNPVESFA
jgi:hypothetical protein